MNQNANTALLSNSSRNKHHQRWMSSPSVRNNAVNHSSICMSWVMRNELGHVESHQDLGNSLEGQLRSFEQNNDVCRSLLLRDQGEGGAQQPMRYVVWETEMRQEQLTQFSQEQPTTPQLERSCEGACCIALRHQAVEVGGNTSKRPRQGKILKSYYQV